MPLHLIIFDIDGTLVDANVVDTEAYSAAIQDYYGIEEINTNWNDYKYSTDSGLLGEIVEAHLGRQPSPVEVAEIQDRFVELLSTRTIMPLAGAKGMIGELRRRKDYRLAIATGGWRVSALYKLRTTGIWFDMPLASGDDHVEREVIVRLAVSRAEKDYAVREFQTVTYVGDADCDYRAAMAHGYRFVGVGNNPRMLRLAGAQVIPDFRHTRTFFDMI